MAIISHQTKNLNAWAQVVAWGPMQAGDQGALLECYAWPHITFQMTAHLDDPIGDLIIDMMGSNDGADPLLMCFSRLCILDPDKFGMNRGINGGLPDDRMHDPFFCADRKARFNFIKPVVRMKPGGNPNVGTAGILMLLSKDIAPVPL